VLSVALLAAVLPVGLVSPTSAGAPPVFEDVPPDAFYADAVAWAVAKGITTGLGGPNQFGPDVVATRSQALTFLWRYVGEPTGFPPSEFEDVPPTRSSPTQLIGRSR
jgi:hypothetical protein